MSEYFNTRHTLIAKIQDQHDDKSWEEFVAFYRPYIYTVVKSMSLPTQEIEDVSQAILLALWERLPSFKYEPQKCKFRTWMNGITFNIVSNAKRKDHSYKKRNSKYALESGSQLPIEPEINKLMDSEWKKHMTQLAIDNIRPAVSDRAMRCFEMFYQGSSVDEIVETLEIKKNSAYVLRRRVLERLRIEIIRLDEELS